MALIADCDAVAVATLDGWITEGGSLNIPMSRKPTGELEAVFSEAHFRHLVVDTNLFIQEVEGMDEIGAGAATNPAAPLGGNRASLTKYQRISYTRYGHVLGTDWSRWLKVS